MTDGFSIHTQQFDGPLDLLLSLIQERKLYINEISLAQVTDAYLGYLDNYTEHPIAETAQFVYIASTLLLIKSRSLLPNMELTEEEEQDIAELERRLKLYRIIRTASRSLGRVWESAPLAPSRYRPLEEVQFRPGKDLTLALMHDVAHSLVSSFPAQIFRPEVRVEATKSLEEVVGTLRERIQRTSRLMFSEIKKGGNKADVIVHFLALLELVKGGIVAAEQGKTFDDIVVASDTVTTPSY